MRGGAFPELSSLVTKAIMMEVYHQQYSEIDDMPIKDVLFFLRFHEAKESYKEQLMQQEKAKINKARGRRR